jgi:hypothetical protein
MVSSIYTAKNNGIMSDIWKILSNFYASMAMSGNMILLFILFNNILFPHCLEFLDVNWTSIHKYNFTISLCLYTWVPFMIMNYFLVYRNNKYKQLIKDYKQFYTKKVFAIYWSVSILLPIIYIFIPKK